MGRPVLASLQSCDRGFLQFRQSLIEVLAPTNYVTREYKHFLLVNEGFSFSSLTASNCKGALAFPAHGGLPLRLCLVLAGRHLPGLGLSVSGCTMG